MLKLLFVLGAASAVLLPVAAQAQLGTNQNSTFYGVTVSSSLDSESDLASIVRNIASLKTYGSNETVTVWASGGWSSYPGREDTYVAYDRYLYHPWTANDGTRFWDNDDYRNIRLITGLLTNRPEYRLYKVDCQANGYRQDLHLAYFPSGETLSYNNDPTSSLIAPANNFEQTLIDSVCAFNA